MKFVHLIVATTLCMVLMPNAGASNTDVLTGTWMLVAADVIRVNGERARDYGAAPAGLLIIDAQGHYSLQIYSAERPKFASKDKLKGTPEEYEAAVLGASTHFGTIRLNPAKREFTVQVEKSSFPNLEGVAQTREYELQDDVLTYRVAPRPDGGTPISVWRRVSSH